ncbi:MAG: hypothetical protein GY824_04300, partial [Delftia sp.]|nr:hypothetical protein [Delftia sp.]
QHFTNRTKELTQLLTDLQPGQITTLCGPGGIGKPALAAEAIWQLFPADQPPDRFPDGIISHTFYGQPKIDLALEKIVYAFGDEPKPTPAAAAQRVLGHRRALLLLDGTEEADNLPALLQLLGGSGILITSRKLKDAAAQRQDMHPLNIPDAVELLNKWGAEWSADQAAAQAICKLIGGLPLAVRLVGRYLNQTPETATEYLKWLQTTPLEALDPDQEQHRLESVPWLLARSLEQVSPQARQVLALVGQLALMPISPPVIAEVIQLPAAEMKQAWRQLTGYGLLQRSGDSYELTHPLIHTYTSCRLTPSDERLARLTTYYINLTKTESQQGLPGYRRLDSHRPHIMHLLNGCMTREDWETARRLAWAINDYLFIQGLWTECITASTVGLTAAQKLNNRQDEESFLSWTGLAYSALGQVEKAIDYYQQALTIAQEIGHRQGEGTKLRSLRPAHRHPAQLLPAPAHHEHA